MATGPYDLGPFQTLSAINFAQGEGDLFVMPRVISNRIRKWIPASETWEDPGATPNPGNLQNLAYDFDNALWYAANTGASDDAWKYDINTATWTFWQNIFANAAFADILTDVIGGLVYIWQSGGPDTGMHSWNPTTGGTSFIVNPTGLGFPIAFSNHGGFCWDPTRNRILMLRRNNSPGNKYIYSITTGGSVSLLFTLPATHNKIGGRFGGLDVDSSGTIWFISDKADFSGRYLCSWDGSTFIEHVNAESVGSGIVENLSVVPELDLIVVSRNLSTQVQSWDGTTYSNLGDIGLQRMIFATTSHLG